MGRKSEIRKAARRASGETSTTNNTQGTNMANEEQQQQAPVTGTQGAANGQEQVGTTGTAGGAQSAALGTDPSGAGQAPGSVDGASGAAPDASAGAFVGVLLGSDRPYAWVQVGSEEVQLGEIVAKAQAASGQTPGEWNALSAADRDAMIDATIAEVQAGAPASLETFTSRQPIQAPEGKAPATETLGTQDTTGAAESPLNPTGVTTTITPDATVTGTLSATPAATIEQAAANTTTSSKEEQVNALVDAALPKLTTPGKLVLQNIQDYMRSMSPDRPLADVDGARMQVRLYRQLMVLLNTLDEDFDVAMNTVLKMLLLGKNDVFHETNAFRFTEQMQLGADERKTFINVMHFLKAMADPKSRALAAKQISINKVWGPSVTEAGRTRVLGYFQL
jgi:hypothetical protein